jgi:spore coat protein U-like protein
MSTFKTKKSTFAIALTSALGLGMIGNTDHVSAGTATDSLAVSATVAANCMFKGSSGVLNFGAYDPINTNATAALDVNGTFEVRCTKGTVADVGMGNGSNFSGGSRRMAGGSYFLPYSLYQNAGRTTVWGDTVDTDTYEYTAVNGGFTPVTVYGRIPGGQDVGAASYSDTVTMTVTF